MRKPLTLLTIISSVSAIISACLGLFYSFGGTQRIVESIYGQQVTLFGDGIYANDSIMKAGATKGTDVVIIITALLLICAVSFLRHKKYTLFLQGGLLSILLYASSCLVIGVSFNRLFLLYVLQFGSVLFAFIFSVSGLVTRKSFDKTLYSKKLTGTAIFLIIAGCSTLVWIPFVIPPIISGQPIEILEIYTTEPTFAIDLAIVLPFALYCGIGLLRKKEAAYQLTPVFLTLLTGVGLTVIFQTIMQYSLGIVLELELILGLVVSFVVLGTVALLLNVRLLKRTV